jgi:hypothetical protein
MTKVSGNGISADFDEAEAVIRRTTDIFLSPVVRTGVFQTVSRGVDIVLDFYPAVRQAGRRFRFATPKQLRFFWWAVSKGLIRVPYQRTRNLARATTIVPVEINASGFTLAVTVDRRIASYADHVIGRTQLPGHKDTGWPILRNKLGEALPRLARQVGTATGRTLRGYIRQGRLG